ncbi:MAG: hypothetical protein LUD18_05080 [Lachnospiraceae bacterium]|nr:hypothetical protein [Lachnospiraceae bacterium]
MKRMKRFLKKALLLILCLAMMQTPAVSNVLGGTSITAQAATKNGLVKKNGKYYYYKNGVKLKNTWKTVTKTSSSGKTTTNRYYFGSNGAAVMATTTMDCTYNIKLKTINGKKYGFDTKARLVSGTYVNEETGKLYYFSSKGVYKEAKTKKLRAAAKRGSDLAKLVKLLGTPKKRTESNSCLILGYTDITLTYAHFTVYGLRAPDGTETVYAVYTI